MNIRRSWDYKTVLASLWIIFTIALACWLFVFNSRLFDQIETLSSPEAHSILRYQKMVASELGTMILALIIGGTGLLYLIWMERRRTDQIHQFFATFTHELKTSLSRLRLQAENLQDDLKRNGRVGSAAIQLLDDVGKLEVQLENSLWIARADEDRIFKEDLLLSRVLSDVAPQFPLLVHLSTDAQLKVDRRAWESILKNIFQNAVVHGLSENIWIEVTKKSDSELLISFRDDGKGFQGQPERLGQIFRRHAQSSGTGLGLFLVQRLSRLLGGTARFITTPPGFKIEIEIPGSLT